MQIDERNPLMLHVTLHVLQIAIYLVSVKDRRRFQLKTVHSLCRLDNRWWSGVTVIHLTPYQVLRLSLLTHCVICYRDGGENIWKEWFLYTSTAKQKALVKGRFGSQTVSERINFIHCPSQNSDHKLSSFRSPFERNPPENIPILFGRSI